MDEYLREVIKIIAEVSETEGQIDSDVDLVSTLGLSSMRVAQVIFSLEDTFDIEIPDTVFKGIITPNRLAEWVREAVS